MVIARLLVGLLLFSAIVCFAFSIATGQARWRRRGVVIVKWTLVAGLAFFGALILERLALLL
ncbi:hypothetical protein [Roseateles saccharophilus]|uniref:Uncharacterized protein n=1 Tax=Roseateles saccharophilus TaxID=304 RepID=A0A4R3VDW1_ROSSA|nr:hypothetical protein [Roseateles saccharophilus]MDG0833011.1 hypothetical protein [Roseateles saccharophilus]TCV02103.1 hypothetical protein EV671_1005138 [Roseateles saccharophilus]